MYINLCTRIYTCGMQTATLPPTHNSTPTYEEVWAESAMHTRYMWGAVLIIFALLGVWLWWAERNDTRIHKEERDRLAHREDTFWDGMKDKRWGPRDY